MPRLPAIGNLRQEFLDTFDIAVAPYAELDPASYLYLWGWDLPIQNVAMQGDEMDGQPSGCFAGGVRRHIY
ncbi:MAG TPA: hypothetical protein VI685_02365 [Candidatus Angelobacter sp.]